MASYLRPRAEVEIFRRFLRSSEKKSNSLALKSGAFEVVNDVVDFVQGGIHSPIFLARITI